MAKLYVVTELGMHYNDETYSQVGGDNCGTPTEAYRDRKNAEKKCKELNKRHLKDNPLESEDGVIQEYFQVVEVDLKDDDDAEDYASARQELDHARARARKAAERKLLDEAKALFAAHPKLKSFGWQQYTDYFNDGDTCTFSAYTCEPDINGENGSDLDSGLEWNSEKECSEQVRKPSAEYTLQKPVSEFLKQFNDEDMEAMFGDHVRVTVKRGKKGGAPKVETEEYTSHD